MSSATADSFPESVGSCCPRTPPTPPAPAPEAPRGGAPVRRQLDFADSDAGAGASAGGDLEDDYEFLMCAIAAADDIERGYSEAQRRAPPCVCGRGECAVRRDERDRLTYVCSSQPKCKHVALCEEVGFTPESQPAVRSHPKTSNPCVFDIRSNHVAEPKTPINNVNLQGAGARTPINVSSQAAVHKTPLYSTSKGAVTTTPVHVSPQGTGTTAVKFSPRGARSHNQSPICPCTAGKCKILRVDNEDCYVCPIPKGQGACNHKVKVSDINAVKEQPRTGDNDLMGDKHLNDSPVEKEAHANNVVQVGDNNTNGSVNPAQAEDNEWPFDVVNDEVVPTAQATPRTEVCQGSPSMLRQPIAMVKTPTKSPLPPYSTYSPMTPRSDYSCYRCREKGHLIRDCPKPSPGNECYNCGMVGHWRSNCPQLRGSWKHVVN